MKVLLIYPPLTFHKLDVSPIVKPVLIGLGYIGTVLAKADYKVKILDCLVSSYDCGRRINVDFTRFGLSDNQIMDEIKSFNPDIVGVSCMFTSYFMDAHNVARIVKEYNKEILVVFGGAHASTFPEAVMKDNNVDVVVIGEGETTIVELLDRYRNKLTFDGVKGIIHRVG